MVLVLFSFSFVAVTFASNLSFLHDSTPISDFNKEDVKLMEEAIEKALNEKKDGEKLAWINEKTKHSGLVNPLSSFSENATECRRVRIVNKSKNWIGENEFKYCKQDGTWVLIKFKKDEKSEN